MREIKFRAWVKHTMDNRWQWAYDKADKKALEIEKNGFKIEFGEEKEWREEFLDQWDNEHKSEDQLTISHRMVYGDEMGIYLNGKMIVTHGYEILKVMQYTGLKDRKGKEIYEVDVLKYKSSPPYEVVYETCRFALSVYTGDGNSIVALPGPNEFMEVIGNIHENPELMEINSGKP